MTKTFHGIVNCAAFNISADGDESFYESRAERDRVLEIKRANAVKRGLSEGASISGIYPIARVLSGSHAIGEMSERIAYGTDY